MQSFSWLWEKEVQCLLCVIFNHGFTNPNRRDAHRDLDDPSHYRHTSGNNTTSSSYNSLALRDLYSKRDKPVDSYIDSRNTVSGRSHVILWFTVCSNSFGVKLPLSLCSKFPVDNWRSLIDWHPVCGSSLLLLSPLFWFSHPLYVVPICLVHKRELAFFFLNLQLH